MWLGFLKYHFTFFPYGLTRNHKWPSPNVSGFRAQLVRALHRHRGVTGSNPPEVLTFSGFNSQLLKLRWSCLTWLLGMYILYSNGHLPEPTGKNIPVICKINQEMSLLIPRPVIRDLRTCLDSWPVITQRTKPLLQQMSSEERWVGQISMSGTLKWKLKIEDLARNSSTSVSTPLLVICPR